MSYYDNENRKNNIKKLVDIAIAVTKLNKSKFTTDRPTLQWYTRVLEKKMVKNLIKSSKLNLDVPITYDRDGVGFISYLMDIKGVPFDEAYSKVFKDGDTIYYIDFLGHKELQRNECGYCDGEGTQTCFYCEGYGTIDCQECEDGTIPCEPCDGGNDENCGTCNGKGYEDCEDCEGEYSHSCSECSGDGYYDCEECDGKTFEEYEVIFEIDSYVVIDDRIKEFSMVLSDGQKTITEFEKICDNYDPPIEYGFLRSYTSEIRSEYESTDWKVEIENQGLKFESEDHKISINVGFEGSDSSIIDEILDEMF